MGLSLKSIGFHGLNLIPGVNINSQLVSDLGNPAAWLLDAVRGPRLLSGENVSGNTAMELTAFYAAIRNIGEDIGKLNVNIFRQAEGGKVKDNNHPAFGLLNIQVNPYVSAMNFYQTLIHWGLNWGNGYAEIERNGRGDPVRMWLIHPSRVEPFFDENQILFYRVSSNITIQGQRFDSIILPAEDMYHLSGLGADGIVGYSVYRILAQSIGVGLATQNCSASYYGNGTTLSGALSTEHKLDPKAYTNLRESWNKLHTGNAGNKNRVAILEQGMKFTPTTSNANEAQLIESRKFTVIEVARMIRVPPHKLQSTDKMTLNNLESQSREYIQDTLTPWIKRIKNETSRKIIKNPNVFAVHEISALTLGDTKTRTGAFKTHRNMGTMSVNEVRDLEDLNAIEEPWANEYHMQMNMTTVEAISEKANLKPNEQNAGTTMDSGDKDEEGRDMEATDNVLELFEAAKKAHLPNFLYAANRIVNKESKALDNHLKKFTANIKKFSGWSEHFFEVQARDIIDAFTPCCEVFVKSFGIDKSNLHPDALADFADNYATDGIEKALKMFEKNVKGENITENLIEAGEKMANSVMNLIAATTKEDKDDKK